MRLFKFFKEICSRRRIGDEQINVTEIVGAEIALAAELAAVGQHHDLFGMAAQRPAHQRLLLSEIHETEVDIDRHRTDEGDIEQMFADHIDGIGAKKSPVAVPQNAANGD